MMVENTGRPSGQGVPTAVGTSEADPVMSKVTAGLCEGFQPLFPERQLLTFHIF